MLSTRTLLPAVLAGLLAACGPADPPMPASPDAAESEATAEILLIRGELYYLERVALPAHSLAVLELRGADRVDAALLASTREDLGTRQVPIGFELSVASADLPETGPFVFRGGIRSHPGPIRVTDTIAIEQRSGAVDVGALRLRPVPMTAFGVPYRCGERTVVFGALGEHQRLVVDDEVIDLQPEISASGARYVAVDDSTTEFWSKGDQAMITLRGEVLDDCERLAEPGLPFTARGQEPGWHLRIDEDGMEIMVRYGDQQLSFPRVAPEISAAGTRYEAESDGHRLTVLVDPQTCTDTMADMVYPFRVRYTLDGDAQMGCGGDPRKVLGGGEWLIEEIGGQAVVAGTLPTIEFMQIEGEDRFAGRASCNRYMGGFHLTGEGVRLSPAASTLMACPDEAQALQERRLLALLDEVYGFGVDEQGRLILRAGGGSIVARR